MLVMMVVMLAIVLLSRGHMGMMGQGADHPEQRASIEQQTKTVHALPTTPTEPTEYSR